MIAADDILFEREVVLDRHWKIVFADPDTDCEGPQVRDWDSIDGRMCAEAFYWLDAEIFVQNGMNWGPDKVGIDPKWDLIFSGSIKWDGCSNWNLPDGCWHMCGPEDHKLFGIVYDEARRLLNTDEF